MCDLLEKIYRVIAGSWPVKILVLVIVYFILKTALVVVFSGWMETVHGITPATSGLIAAFCAILLTLGLWILLIAAVVRCRQGRGGGAGLE